MPLFREGFVLSSVDSQASLYINNNKVYEKSPAKRVYEYYVRGLIFSRKTMPPPLYVREGGIKKIYTPDPKTKQIVLTYTEPTTLTIYTTAQGEDVSLVDQAYSSTIYVSSQHLTFFHEKCYSGDYNVINTIYGRTETVAIKSRCEQAIEPSYMSLNVRIKVPYFYTNYPTYVAYSITGLQYLVPMDCRGRYISPPNISPREIVADTALKAGNVFNDNEAKKYDCDPYIVVYWNGAFIKKENVRQGDYVEFNDNIRIYPMDGRSTLTVSLLHVKFEPPTTWFGPEGCMAHYASGNDPLLTCFLFKKFRITFEYGEIRSIDTYPNYYKRGYVDPDVLDYSPKELVRMYRVSTGVYDFEVLPRIGYRNYIDVPELRYDVVLRALQWNDRLNTERIDVSYDLLRSDDLVLDNVLSNVNVLINNQSVRRSGTITFRY